MPQVERGLRRGLTLLAVVFVLVSCGRSPQTAAELSAAPVRRVVAMLASHPNWKPGRCLCVGQFNGDAVEDFPAGLLGAEFAGHPWVRNWSECAPSYGKAKGLAQCQGGMTDYICSVTDKPDLPSGTTRVECHINAKNELLFDEYNVSRGDNGVEVHAVSLKASQRLKTVEKPDER